MSVINNALTKVAEKEEGKASPLKQAEIPKVKSSGKLAWAVGGFALSIAVGGWAVSTQFDDGTESSVSAASAVSEQPEAVKSEEVTVIAGKAEDTSGTEKVSGAVSPTSQQVSSEDIKVYEAASLTTTEPKSQSVVPEKKKQITAKAQAVKTSPVKAKQKASKVAKVSKAQEAEEKPLALAQVATHKPDVEPVAANMTVEHVELSPEQVARTAIERAKRALDANDLDTAIREYETALKYRPRDDNTRRKLAALYYGKSNLRKSVDVLRKGIRLEEGNQKLRIALSKILLKEGQSEAALTPLSYLPDNPGVEYLSLRAGLAQQIKNNPLALESYRLLVEKEGDNARWWLGLGIQQERSQQHQDAILSYEKALGRVGVSKKTQTFIRERLSLLKSLKETSSGD
ncbi:tetratricopeptide repeat protein [Vibrio sp. JC009]|uniref:tetratricopeptide repeat protein n=1 Tax=Vibrio sp. JC009 TaxID=2912314 RepID=UPI0023B1405F|nr:tetratricopeptide repeat protein [Vibrio sp. JC009]WED21547.1 tetratricopeptide repeat protein [Vibrio sp. JC009]